MDIQELRNQPHLSVSAINDYLDCSLSYKFGRIDGIAPEYTATTLLFGSAIHKTLEEYHLAKMNKHTRTLEQLLRHFESQWMEIIQNTPDAQFKNGDNFDSLLEKGKILLTVYFQEYPKDNFKILGTEIPFSFQLPDVPIPIIGVMDLVEEDEGGNIIIVDHKTASRAYSKDDIDKCLQMTVYHMAAKRNGFEDREILLRLDCLIKTKTPKFEQYYTVRSEEDEQRAVKKIQQIWKSIEKEVFIPNDTSWKCSYCAFKNCCNEWFQG